LRPLNFLCCEVKQIDGFWRSELRGFVFVFVFLCLCVCGVVFVCVCLFVCVFVLCVCCVFVLCCCVEENEMLVLLLVCDVSPDEVSRRSCCYELA